VRRPSPRASVALVVLACAAVALALRLYGVTWGLPATNYNPDEVPILNRALAFATGDLNPHNFLYPTLYFYALFVWEGLFFAAGWVSGVYESAAAFQDAFFVDPTAHFAAARALAAVSGTLMVWVTYRIGARLYGAAVGLGAALFTAVAPLAVRDAHYVKLDVPAALVAALTMAAVARLVADRTGAERRGPWIQAGLLAGLTASTHYYAVFIVCAIGAAAFAMAADTGRWRATARLLAWAAGASVVGFFIGTPFLLVEPATAVPDFAELRKVNIDRAVSASSGPFVSLGPYLHLIGSEVMGWPVAWAAGVGFVLALVTDWRRGLVLAAMPLAFLAFVSNTVPMTRYLNVLVPFLAVAASFAVVGIGALAGRLRGPVMATVMLAAAIPGLVMSVQWDRFLLTDDTRTLAYRYVAREIPSGASVLIQPYSAPLRQSREALVEALRATLGSETEASIKFQIQLALSPYPEPSYRTIYLGEGGMDVDKIYVPMSAVSGPAGPARLRELGIEYVVLKRSPVSDPELTAVEAVLAREASRIATFSPYPGGLVPPPGTAPAPFFHNTAATLDPALERPGPIVDVWALRR